MINYKEISLKKIVKLCKELQTLKFNFLKSQLEQGKFTQNSGLEWIIIELKKIGEHNFQTLIPNFLDAMAKAFLLNVS